MGDDSPRIPGPIRDRFDGVGQSFEPGEVAGGGFLLPPLEWGGPSAASCGAREAGHLSLHGGRPVSPGDVRLQAATGETAWGTDAGVVYERPAGGATAGPGAGLFRAAVCFFAAGAGGP